MSNCDEIALFVRTELFQAMFREIGNPYLSVSLSGLQVPWAVWIHAVPGANFNELSGLDLACRISVTSETAVAMCTSSTAT